MFHTMRKSKQSAGNKTHHITVPHFTEYTLHFCKSPAYIKIARHSAQFFFIICRLHSNKGQQIAIIVCFVSFHVIIPTFAKTRLIITM